MTTRKLEISNFRNLGIGERITLELNSNVDEKQGDLVILIGENNIGKSNVIAALKAIGSQSMTENDKPNFLDYEENKPSLELIHRELINVNKSKNDINLQRTLDKSFEKKVFNIVFTEDSLKKGASDKNMSNDDYINFCKNLLTQSKEKLCLHDLDTTKDTPKSKPRQEIRLILKDLDYIFLCSARLGKDLQCFRVMKKAYDNIKNIDKAFIANCDFDIECKMPNLLDNANELKKKLKEDFEEWQDEIPQSDVENNSKKSIKFIYSDETMDVIDKKGTIEAVDDKFNDFDNFFEDYNVNQQSYNKVKNEWNEWKYNNDNKENEFMKEISSFYQRLQESRMGGIEWETRRIGSFDDSRAYPYSGKDNIELLEYEFEYFINTPNKYSKEIENLKQELEREKPEIIQNVYQGTYLFQQFYNRLREIFFPKLESFIVYQKGVIEGDESIIPMIIDYKEQKLNDDDLNTKPEFFEESQFFQSLCVILDADTQKWISTIKQHYESNRSYQRKLLTRRINEVIKESITKRFNELYYGTDKKEIYDFEVNLEEYKIEFLLYKNDNPLKLSQQSAGFQWFFNFFFNFLYANSIKSGDIVSLDELGGSLSIPAKRDLRAFLKDFAKKHNITFVIATHDAFLIDINHLDELRIVEQNDKGIGVKITNNFAILDDKKNELDTLAKIKRALGTTNHFDMTNGDCNIIFVEGITDYNYLTKFKLLYEKEKGKELDIAFLPVGGLGKFENSKLTEKQKKIIKELPQIAKVNKERYAVLLVDNDLMGNAIYDEVAKNKQDNKNLDIIKISDPFNDKNKNDNKIKNIEDLFSQNDKEKYKEILKAKDSEYASGTLASKNFKSDENEVESETKKNFFHLLEYLHKYKTDLNA